MVLVVGVDVGVVLKIATLWVQCDVLLLVFEVFFVANAVFVVAWTPDFAFVLTLVWLRNLWRFYARVAKSNFPALECAISPLALPLFAALLYRSWFQNRVLHRVGWKGRTYPV